LIPTDEDSVAHLHRLYITTEPTNVTAEKLRSLIERSLGDPEQFPIIHARAKIASLARALGVNSPISYVACNVADLERKLEIVGFPAVLKTDASMGGRGVAIVQNLAEAKRAFRKFSVSPSVLRTLKRLVINLDANLVMPCLLQRRARISIQAFVCGKLANAAVACWKGEVLAHVTVEVLATQYANGPATVVNVITHSEISEAVALVTRQLNLSGLCGFDFILDPIDGRAHMIELNPRATQTCHLVSSEGKRLLASLAAQLQQPAAAGRLGIPIWGPIVLFPYAMAEEQNVYPKDVFKDVPWQSPQLVSLARGHPVRQLLLTKFRMQSVLAIFRQFSKS
jgi:hypothetical protein